MADRFTITETERPLRFAEPLLPQAAVWHLMREHAQTLKAERDDWHKLVASERDRMGKLILDVADVFHQLQALVTAQTEKLDAAGLRDEAQMLDAICGKLREVLERAGVRVEILDGKPYTLGMIDWTEIVASVPTQGISQVLVRETLVPAIFWRAELLRPGKIVLATPEAGQRPDIVKEGSHE
jgi:murein L,D-transpeptidase YcbB/YkuD